MEKVKPDLTKEQNDATCKAIADSMADVLSRGGIGADTDTVLTVAKCLGFLRGKRGKNDGTTFAGVEVELPGVRFANDHGKNVSDVIAGLVVARNMFEYQQLRADIAREQAVIDGLNAAIPKMAAGEGRTLASKQRTEAQENVKAKTEKLARYRDLAVAANMETLRQQKVALAKATEELSAFEKFGADNPALADMLQVKRNDVSAAEHRFASLLAETEKLTGGKVEISA